MKNTPQASSIATVLPVVNGDNNVQEIDARPDRELLESTGDAVSRVSNILAAVSLLLITAVNVANVVARYIFTSPFAWAEELMIYLMILIVFAGCVTATWHQIHIRIDMLTVLLNPRVQVVVNVVVTAVGVVALALIIKASLVSIERLYRFEQLSLALEAPLWIPQSFVSLGLSIVAVMMVVRLWVPRRDSHSAESGK
jgi:C4-dicarboxylate transporter DctQ subunit